MSGILPILLLMGGSFLFGIAKAGIPGMGVLAVPLFVAVLPAKVASGVILPLLIAGDAIASFSYKRSVDWKACLKIMPWTALGIIVGWFWMGRVEDSQVRIAIGLIVLFLLGLNQYEKRYAIEKASHWASKSWAICLIGFIGGLCTMLANAAGPVIALYFLALKMKKEVFLGSSAIFFLVINWVKVPFSFQLGLIHEDTLWLNLYLLPMVFLGAGTGMFIVRRMSPKTFEKTVEVLTAAGAIKILVG